jgi:hypothetical protein
MVLFQGWRTLVPPIPIADFVASYIAVRIHKGQTQTAMLTHR